VLDELDQLADRLAGNGPRTGAESTGGRPASPFAALTQRELDVVKLVGMGLTDRQAANRLHVSIRTVESHLGNIYRKLGVPSRSVLAGMLARDPEHGDVLAL
jgi:DNA-binding CsgD family transcriptional regulator